MTDAGLMQCPFCGNVAMCKFNHESNDSYYYAECRACFSRGAPRFTAAYDPCHLAKDAAIEAWNKRTYSKDAILVIIKAMPDMYKKMMDIE